MSIEVPLLAGVLLLLLPAVTLLLAYGLFFLGRPLSPFTFPIAAAVSPCLLFALARKGYSGVGIAGGIVLAALATASAFVFARNFWDVTYDGQWYHQNGVIAFARGFNPVGPPLVAQPVENAGLFNYYAKGGGLFQAAVYLLGGRIEQAKVLNPLLMVGAGLLAFVALRIRTPASFPLAAGLAVLIVLNPSTFKELPSFMVDSALDSCLTAAIALTLVAWGRPGAIPFLGLAAAIVMGSNLKASGLVYLGAVVASGVLIALAQKRFSWSFRWALVSGISLVVAMGVCGWSPYVTNTIRKGHPLYPIMGPGKFDIMKHTRPAGFAEMGRFERVARTVFSATNSRNRCDTVFKVPFTLAKDNFEYMATADTRVAGLGPWFSGALVLTLIALAAARLGGADPSLLRWSLLVQGLLLGSVFLTGEGWWARLAPQLWLLPIVAAIPGMCSNARGPRWAAVALLAVLWANAGIVGIVHFTTREDRRVGEQLAKLARVPQPVELIYNRFDAAAVRLEEAGIRYWVSAKPSCPNPERLVSSQAEICRSRSSQ